nr:hypothetical protein [Cytophagales bacterium]
MGIDRKFRLPRIWSNEVLKKIAPLFTGKVANVSGWKDEDKQGGFYQDYFVNASSYTITNYEGCRGFQGEKDEIPLDLEKELPNKLIGAFDVVFNHTTLEHIYEVRTAFKNLCLMSSDTVIVVVPFAQTQHEQENIQDFWRFTPTALRRLFDENEMGVVYEAANDDRNAGIYVTMVGSKNPDKWIGKMPSYRPLKEIAWTLGTSRLQRIKRFIKRRMPERA